MAAQLGEQMSVRSGYSAVSYVTDDSDLKPGQRAFSLPYRVCVQQGLGRMLVRSVARVDDGSAHHLRQLMWHASRRMADYDRVGRHGFEIARRVDQGLSLANRRRGS